MKVYTPSHSIIHETSIDISNRVNISKPVNLVQYDSLPIIKVNLYYGHERYTIPTGIDLVRLRMGRLPSQYYYKDILGWSSDKQSVYIQVEEDMSKDIGEFGLVIEFIKFDYESSKNKASYYIYGSNIVSYLGSGLYRLKEFFSNSNQQTLDYNIYTGSYILNSIDNRPSVVDTRWTINTVLKYNNNPFPAITSFRKISGELIRGMLLFGAYYNDSSKGVDSVYSNTSISRVSVLEDVYNEVWVFPRVGSEYNNFEFQLQLEEGTEATEFEPPIKLMVAASSKINVTVERNPVQEDHINKQETEVK